MDFTKILTIENINKLNTSEKFNDVILSNDFYDKPGNQHYRLLSYFSTLFNNSNIIEIGTHMGESAIALSYNETNTIYTFDIIDKIKPDKKPKKNVNYIIDDIMTNDLSRSKWMETILSSSFIFLDVDPHNGHMEYNFYLFLKENNYKGFVICDDIWYFKDMRDNFWYKIDDKYKYDISHLGHWSGTGIINFNKQNLFYKNELSNWTLFTSYFNLTKFSDASDEINKRDKNYYLSHSLSTMCLPYNLVIYCDSESYEDIYKLRPDYLREKTKYYIIEFDDIKFKNNSVYDNLTFHKCRNKIIDNRKQKPYHFDNRNTASYYLFCMSRYVLMKELIQQNPFDSTHFCWINFCIERMGYSNLKYLNEALSVNRNKFSTCYIDYIPDELVFNTNEYYKWGRCGMCSGFFTGNKEYMYKVCDLIEEKFLLYLSLGYGHADEQLYSPVYFENKELFEHYYGDYQQMITNYKYIYESPERPVMNFISNSFKHNNFNKCIECCEFILKSLELEKCNLGNDYYNLLMENYIVSKFNTHFYLNKYVSIKNELKSVYDIIQKSLNKGDNSSCFKYCEILLNYINNNNIDCPSDIYFKIYFCYYVSSFYFNKNKSYEIVDKIFSLCNENKDFKDEYKKNKEFYDNQFKFINYKKNNMKLAYYTCFFGGNNNYSFLIPPIPSEEYSCYYFTNNKDIYDKLKDTGFIRVFIDNIPIYNNHNKDSMSYKIYRCNPYDYGILKDYDYLCWFDNKLQVFDHKIDELVYELDKSNKSIIFTRHPYYKKYNNIWDEYNLSMNIEKYKKEESKQFNYINKMIDKGYDISNENNYLSAGFIIRKNNKTSKEFGLEWFNNILECGIQDQISLYFISQDYSEHIKEIEHQFLWKYFFE